MRFRKGPQLLASVLFLSTVLSSAPKADVVGNALEIDWFNPLFELVATNDAALTQITHAGDGSDRLFVVEQVGKIKIVQQGAVSSTPFLSITNRVAFGGERGLLSAAFAKDFKTTGNFYVNYTRRPDGATVVSRFRADADGKTADPLTEEILLVVPQPFPNHNGGQIAFGPDGFLYIGMGDGGGFGDPSNNAQNSQSLLGKILRIDVSGSTTNYSIPPTNPFLGRTNTLPEIWAMGLRNPWRFSFDRVTGDLIIADVGENTLEEINFQNGGSPGGENYGWRLYEGTRAYQLPSDSPPVTSLTFPIATYGRSFGGSVTGGYVIRTSAAERSYGVYIYADFLTGRMGGLTKQGTNWVQADLGQSGLRITSFGEDEDGSVYVAHSPPGTRPRSAIYRIRDDRRAHTPMLSLPGGSYDREQVVILTSTSPRTRIHYTRDGTDPTELSPWVSSGESLVISESQVIKAKAYREDLSPSAIIASSYNLLLTVTATPMGSVTNGTPITLQTSSSNALIRYTLDGTAPSESSPIYNGPFSVEGDQTIWAVASKPGWQAGEFRSYFGLLIPEWVTIQTFAGTGVAGSVDGPSRTAQFSTPFALCIDHSGSIFVGETGLPGSVRRISRDGSVSTVWTNLANPIALTADNVGNIFIVEGLASRILKAAPGGTPSEYITRNFSSDKARGLHVDSRGNVYSAMGGTLWGFAPPDQAVLFNMLPVNNKGLGLAFSEEGTPFVGTDGGVIFFDPQGFPHFYAGGLPGRVAGGKTGHSDGDRLRAQFSDALLIYHPAVGATRAIAFDSTGNLFVADGNVVRKIDRDGEVSTLVTELPSRNKGLIGGLAIALNGDIYVSAGVTIQRISRDRDRDGVADTDERGAFAIGRDDRLVDSDADGASNTAEYLYGTDPLDSASSPRLKYSLLQDGMLALSLDISPIGDLIIQRSSDLENWVNITDVPNTGTIIIPVKDDRTFFRISVE